MEAATKEMQAKYRRAWSKNTPLDLKEIDPHGFLQKDLGIVDEEPVEQWSDEEEAALEAEGKEEGQEEGEKVKRPSQVARDQFGMPDVPWAEVYNFAPRKSEKSEDVLRTFEARKSLRHLFLQRSPSL